MADSTPLQRRGRGGEISAPKIGISGRGWDAFV